MRLEEPEAGFQVLEFEVNKLACLVKFSSFFFFSPHFYCNIHAELELLYRCDDALDL
jgi:hypothetical protein